MVNARLGGCILLIYKIAWKGTVILEWSVLKDPVIHLLKKKKKKKKDKQPGFYKKH